MRPAPLPRLPAPVLAAALAILATAPVRAQSTHPAATAAAGADSLVALTERFARSFLGGPGRPRDFFPERGQVTYVHTEHTDSGPRVVTRSYPARNLFSSPPASLRNVLDLSHHGQPIGLFVHQIEARQIITPPLRWRRVGQTRLVPRGEPDGSPFFVEWRRDGEKWVVSAFGDEHFIKPPFPKWCC